MSCALPPPGQVAYKFYSRPFAFLLLLLLFLIIMFSCISFACLLAYYIYVVLYISSSSTLYSRLHHLSKPTRAQVGLQGIQFTKKYVIFLSIFFYIYSVVVARYYFLVFCCCSNPSPCHLRRGRFLPKNLVFFPWWSSLSNFFFLVWSSVFFFFLINYNKSYHNNNN